MTSLGNDCYVGRLNYVELNPPVSGGGFDPNDILPITCDNPDSAVGINKTNPDPDSLDVVGKIVSTVNNKKVSLDEGVVRCNNGVADTLELEGSGTGNDAQVVCFRRDFQIRNDTASGQIRTIINGAENTNFLASGQVGIGISTPDRANKLQINSEAQGFRPPQLTDAQMNAVSVGSQASRGCMCYNISQNRLFYYNGTGWLPLP